MAGKKIAIITARGGSKRIPKKNIKEFCGKPIIVYSIEAALQSLLFDEVMVSTDDDEIKDIALQNGAKVPFMRSQKASDDYATTMDVLCEVVEQYRKLGITFSTICCIYPTAPFVTGEKLICAYEKLVTENADVVFPVVPFSFPPQRANVIKNGLLEYINPEMQFKRSQDLEKWYHDVGQYYIYDSRCFYGKIPGTVKTMVPIVVSELEAQDIDNEMDWQLAELKYKLVRSVLYSGE